MAVRATPLWIAAGNYTDTDLRAYFAMLGEPCAAGGVRRTAAGDMLVSAPGGMNVAVAVGSAWIPGTDAAGQGMYLVDNPTSTTLSIGANGSGNPRIDRIVCDVNDPAYTGAGSPLFSLVVVAGTPAGSPVAPAVPPSAISLARVAVANGAASIVAGNLTDERAFCDQAVDPLVYATSSTTLQQTSSAAFADITFTQNASWTGITGHLYRVHMKLAAQVNVGAGNPSWQLVTGTSGAGTVISEFEAPVQAQSSYAQGDLSGYLIGAGATLSAHGRAAIGANRLDMQPGGLRSFFMVEDKGLM